MFEPETEDAIWNTLEEEQRRRESFSATFTPQYSQRLGQVHSAYPFLEPGVKLALAKSELTDQQVLEIAKTSARYAPKVKQEKEKKKKSWWERNFVDKLKTGSRYTFAALNFPVDMVQGAAGQFFDNDPGVSGWFISTDLGSLIANDEEAGSGFFIGGRAKELQAERARRYRGTIDGSAFTIGRGLASVAFTPDSTAYRLMSGAFDAATALVVPAVPGAKQAGQLLRTTAEAGKGGKVVATAAEATRLVGAGSREVGLTKLNAEEIDNIRKGVLIGDQVDYESANRFFKTSAGRRVIQRTAETEDFAETWALWGRKLDADTTQKLADAKTETDVMNVLLDKLGTQITSTQGLSGTKRTYVSLAQRNKLLASMPLGEGVSRAFAKMPQRNINLFQAETARDQISQLNTIERSLALFKVDPTIRKDVINRAGKLLVTKNEQQIEKFYDDLEELFKTSMEAAGTRREILDEVFGSFRRYREELPQFSADDLGQFDDLGMASTMLSGSPDAANLVNIGPLAAGELATRELHIPDPKIVRRLTNNVNWLWVKKDPNIDKLREAGQLRLPFAAAEYFQEKIWRQFITATIGNFVRNVVDSQVSIALSGKSAAVSPFFHPFQYMRMARDEKRMVTLLGNTFDQPVRASDMDDALVDFRAATGDMLYNQVTNPVELHKRATKLGVFKPYMRRPNEISDDVVRAHGDELGRISSDWATRQLASGMEGKDVIKLIKDGDPEAVKWFTRMRNRYRSGVPIYNKATKETEFVKIDLDFDENLVRLVDAQGRRLSKITGDNPELLGVVASGKLPAIMVDSRAVRGEIKPGARVKVKTGRKAREYDATVVDIDPRSGQVQLQPFAFDGMGDNSQELVALLRNPKIYNDPKMPPRVVGEVRDLNTKQASTLTMAMNRMIRSFHANLYEQPIGKLERSPLFRSLYYNWVDKLAVSMDQASIQAIIDDVIAAAGNENPERYLPAGLWNKLNDLNQNPDKLYGTLTREEVNSFASGNALDEMEKMLYNASERRNATDVLRILSPFAQQQAEFFGRMGRFFFSPVAGGRLGYVPNAQALRKLQLIVDGGREADPDGDGRGFFYKNPQTGQWSFTFPLTGALSEMAFGIRAPLTAPVKGVALGLDVRPGLGPFGTLAASQILQDVPSQDFARKILLPYGERSSLVGAVTPTWLTKIYDGLTGNEGGRFFANTYVETMQALSATGEYNLSDPNEQERLLNDARRKAQMLVILRGVTQFTGPASGDYDIKIPTDQGDIYTTGLAFALQNLRNDNYDTATLRFIQIFGEDAFTYLSNKTVSEVGGLEANSQFFDWQRQNGSLFKQYKEVAGYFGPTGTDFDFEAYTRQLQTGARRRLTAEEVLDAAERAIGLAYYRDMRNQFEGTMTKEQRQYLADYKELVKQKYPGFANMQFDPNETQRQIDLLFQAAKREDLNGNGVAEGLRFYEQVRAMALQEAQSRGFRSLKSDELADLHEYLQSYADAIIQKYPDFARVYNRVLLQEID